MNATLKFREKLSYGVADTAFSLTDVVGIDPKLAAIAFFIGKSWDYINDPIMGYLSDRTRSKWGHRRPFLLFGIVFALAYPLDREKYNEVRARLRERDETAGAGGA